jgi:Predicted membrane protein (DUF2238)
VDARTLVMGDWHPVVRDPLDLLRGALVVGAVVSAIAGEVGGAVYLAASAAGALLVRRLELPRLIDLAFVLALTITGFGEALGFYDRWAWFDRVVHFVVPMLFAPVAYIALARADVVLDPKDQHADVRRAPALFILCVAFGIALGAVWEIVEWASDAVGGTNLSENNDDTVGDLIADTSGSLVGGALLLLWTYKGWGAVRRIPGDNRREAVTD